MTHKMALLGSVFALAAIPAGGALAQTAVAPSAEAAAPAPESASVEEVVVTARKREESLQNIPVAVSAISGQNLAREGIREVDDLSRVVPSLSMQGNVANTGTGVIVSLRGQAASDVLLTQSQPVGFYEDSVNIPHPTGTDLAFFDLQRVEVLKGPQGTLYGRNTTGGAINIITRGADYDGYHGFVYGEVGNYDDWKAAAAVNIPIVEDKLAMRVAYQHWNRDGFGRSAITGEKLGDDRDDNIARLSLKFDPSPVFTASLKAEYFDARRTGQLYQTAELYPQTASLADTEWALEGSRGGAAPSTLVANNHDLFTNYSAVDQYERLTGYHGVLDMSWDINDYVRLRSITGVHEFTDHRVFDLSSLPLQAYVVGIAANAIQPVMGTETRPLQPDEQSKQWTQEFNLSGAAFDKHLNWLVGAFMSSDSGNEDEVASVYPQVIADVTAPPLGIGYPFDASFHSLNVGNNTWALFTQNDIKFNDVFSITAGARYTEERLDQDIAFTLRDLADGLYNCQAGPLAGSAVANQVNESACAIHQSAKFTGASYLLSFNFQLNPDTLFYVKTARGFRGGALQVRAPSLPAAAPEIATDYEVGLKTDLFERRLRANLAAYQTNYSNKQETAIIDQNGIQFTPILNAASARIRGVEGEFTAVPFKGLSLSAEFGYIDSEFLSYPNALTPFGTTINASGLPFSDSFNSPKWTYNVGGRYVWDLGPGQVGLSANYAWRGRTPLTPLNEDPNVSSALLNELAAAHGLLNANLEYDLADMGLTFTLFSTNLTNNRYRTYAETFQNYGVTTTTAEPRMYGFSVRKTFGAE